MNTVEHPRPANRAHSPVFPWLIYLVVLALLTILEAVWTPETGLDEILDPAILVCALPGAVAVWGWTFRLVLQYRHTSLRVSILSKAVAWSFLGPLFAFGSTLALNSVFHGDIDGGQLLFYLPVVALLLPILLLLFTHIFTRQQT